MNLNLRAAEPSDIAQIADIWHEGWHTGHAAICPEELTALRTRPSFAERIEAHLGKTVVGVKDGQIIGFHMLKSSELYQFYVSRAGRGTGVAALLIADAERRFAALGQTSAWLACSIGNDRAARFYEKSGWVRTGTVVEQLEVSTGTFPLEVWKYEKVLA